MMYKLHNITNKGANNKHILKAKQQSIKTMICRMYNNTIIKDANNKCTLKVKQQSIKTMMHKLYNTIIKDANNKHILKTKRTITTTIQTICMKCNTKDIKQQLRH